MIVKLENVPRIGDSVVDEKLRSVGRIVDIIGPVSSPYATVRPSISDAGKLSNAVLYSVPSKRRKEKRLNEGFRRRA